MATGRAAIWKSKVYSHVRPLIAHHIVLYYCFCAQTTAVVELVIDDSSVPLAAMYRRSRERLPSRANGACNRSRKKVLCLRLAMRGFYTGLASVCAAPCDYSSSKASSVPLLFAATRVFESGRQQTEVTELPGESRQ